MSSADYFRIHCKKKRTNRKLARYRAEVLHAEEKLLKLETQLVEAATAEDGTVVPGETLLAKEKRALLIEYSRIHANSEEFWEVIPRDVNISHSWCANEDCTRGRGNYVKMYYCVLMKGYSPRLCDECFEKPNVREENGPHKNLDSWLLAHMKKPYATGLVLDDNSWTITEPAST